GAVGTGGGVDAGHPEAAEIALAAFSADVSVLPGLVNDFDGDREQSRSTAPETLGAVENAIAAPARLKSTFCSGHGGASTVGEHDLDAFFERTADHVVVAQAAQAFARFLLHSVVAAAFGAANAARSGHPESLGGRTIRLHFRHGGLFLALQGCLGEA